MVLALPMGLAAQQTTSRATRQDQVAEQYRIFTAALAAVEQEYVEKIESERLVYGAIEGMLRTLDPHSSFLDPRQYAQMRERQSGQYFGIGVSIVSPGGDVTVTSVFEHSPAHRAGIRRGDVIAKVGAEDAKGWTTNDVVARVKGPKGTTVDLSMRRPGVDALIQMTVERDEIKIATVRTAFMVAPGTGYVRLQDFSETTNAELTEALSSLKKDGMTRVLLDLRDNPGGPLDQAIAVANQFLGRGLKIVSTHGRVPNSNEEYHATEQGKYRTEPMIVLVNRGSASASEIVTGAMQDHDRALIVGETTFGKALVQSVYPISNSAGLALTTGRYHTPSGRMIQRPWDGSFDEYLTYSQRDQEATKTHLPADLTYTDAGRKVYGGGGIEPDHFLPGPVEGFNPTRFSRLLKERQVFAGFAERFTREGDARPGSRYAAKAHKVALGWQVTPELLAEFRDYLVELRVKVDDAALKTDAEFIKAMIRFEVDVDLFGVGEARRNLTKVDPQAQAALGYFTEASQLLQLPPKK